MFASPNEDDDGDHDGIDGDENDDAGDDSDKADDYLHDCFADAK